MMRMRRSPGTILLILGMTLASLRAAAEPIRVLGGMTYDAAVDSAPRIRILQGAQQWSAQ